MYPQSWRNYSEAEKQSLLREEQEWLRRAGDRAQTLGVRIGIENLRPTRNVRNTGMQCSLTCWPNRCETSIIPRSALRWM